MTNGEEFNRYFWKHYQFWMLVFSAVSICAIAYFSYLSYTTQSILKSIEETRQREKFSNDLEIVFLSNAFAGCSPAKANYELRLINKLWGQVFYFDIVGTWCQALVLKYLPVWKCELTVRISNYQRGEG